MSDGEPEFPNDITWPRLADSDLPRDPRIMDDYDNLMTPMSHGQVVAWSPDDDEVAGTSWFECLGTLNGTIPVNAVPDWGSSVNAISAAFAARHRLRFIPTPSKSIGLLSGNHAKSIGRVSVCFRFKNEARGYWRDFHVLRKSVCDVILGKRFLAETKTLTKFTTRITERIRLCVRRRGRLFLLDDSQRDVIRCEVNGVQAQAFPDTGSDLMAVSGAFARRNGFHVLTDKSHRREFELVDGSVVRTSGMVLGAKLGFEGPLSYDDLESIDHDKYSNFTARFSSNGRGKDSGLGRAIFVCDLHVIEDLPFDLILSGDFIFRNRVFVSFRNLFVTSTSDTTNLKDNNSQGHRLLFIRRRVRRWRTLQRDPTRESIGR